MNDSIYFMVESGPVLDLAKKVALERVEVNKTLREYAASIGARKIWTSGFDGSLSGVEFEGAVPDGFTKPDRKGVSKPKKGSKYEQEFADLPLPMNDALAIQELLNVPFRISYEYKNGGKGSAAIGHPFVEAGFLWLGTDGPFCMYIPDVQAAVSMYEKDGAVVDDHCKNFKAEFEGCRRIHEEEWKLEVAKFNLELKKATA
jgi:hypothetical protein